MEQPPTLTGEESTLHSRNRNVKRRDSLDNFIRALELSHGRTTLINGIHELGYALPTDVVWPFARNFRSCAKHVYESKHLSSRA